MYAIRHKKTKKWVYGTDRRCRHLLKKRRCSYKDRNYEYDFNNPGRCVIYNQRTSFHQALLYEELSSAFLDFELRGCGKDYEVVRVALLTEDELHAKDYLISEYQARIAKLEHVKDYLISEYQSRIAKLEKEINNG